MCTVIGFDLVVFSFRPVSILVGRERIENATVSVRNCLRFTYCRRLKLTVLCNGDQITFRNTDALCGFTFDRDREANHSRDTRYFKRFAILNGVGLICFEGGLLFDFLFNFDLTTVLADVLLTLILPPSSFADRRLRGHPDQLA